MENVKTVAAKATNVKKLLASGDGSKQPLVWIAAPSGVGKTEFAKDLSQVLTDYALLHTDDYGDTLDGKWIVDWRRVVDDMSKARAEGYIIEGTADNMEQGIKLVSELVSDLRAIIPVQLVVEPQLFKDIMAAKAKDGKARNVEPAWVDHWLKKSKLPASKVTRLIADKNQLYQKMFPKGVTHPMVVPNRSKGRPVTKGWASKAKSEASKTKQKSNSTREEGTKTNGKDPYTTLTVGDTKYFVFVHPKRLREAEFTKEQVSEALKLANEEGNTLQLVDGAVPANIKMFDLTPHEGKNLGIHIASGEHKGRKFSHSIDKDYVLEVSEDGKWVLINEKGRKFTLQYMIDDEYS